jgi:hypothetical protein
MCFWVLQLFLFLLISLKFQSRSEILSEKNAKHPGFSDKTESQLSLDKTVDVVLDSFDNLFCRRCLVHSTSGYISPLVLFLVFRRFVRLHSSRCDLFHICSFRFLIAVSMAALKT